MLPFIGGRVAARGEDGDDDDDKYRKRNFASRGAVMATTFVLVIVAIFFVAIGLAVPADPSSAGGAGQSPVAASPPPLRRRPDAPASVLGGPAVGALGSGVGAYGEARHVAGPADENAMQRALKTLRRRNVELEKDTAHWARVMRDASRAAERERANREAAERELSERNAQLQQRLERALASAGGVQGGAGPEAGLPNLRVFVYDMPRAFTEAPVALNPNCRPEAGNTWQTKYTAEVYIHEQLLRSPLRTRDPERADLFYVPLYLGCFMHVRGTNFTRGHAYLRRAHAHVRDAGPYWDRNQGRDHVVTLTHDLGGCVAPFMPFRHSILITNTGELMNRRSDMEAYTSMYDPRYKRVRDLSLPCFQPWKDVVVPPMITDPRLLAARGGNKEANHQRNVLASFRGTVISGGPWNHYSRGIRQLWLKQFGQHDPEIRIVSSHPDNAKNKEYTADYFKDFTHSKFCLCPPGWATWTPRLYEGLLAGCVPALVSDHNVLPFARTTNYTEFSVSVPEARAKDLRQELKAVSERHLAELQAGLRRVWPRFVWTLPEPKPGDAFHYLAHELAWRARTLKHVLHAEAAGEVLTPARAGEGHAQAPDLDPGPRSSTDANVR